MTRCGLSLMYCSDTGFYLYLLPFQLVSSPSMHGFRRACYFGGGNAVFTVSVNGLTSHMLALLLAHVRDGYHVVRKHWGGDRIVVDILDDKSHNVCVCVPWMLQNFPLKCWHSVCLKMSVCEVWGEKSTIAKDNPWANSVESKQRQAENIPLHASCLAMLMPKVSHLFLLKSTQTKTADKASS